MGPEQFSLAGKTAVITGGGRGIGKSIALAFAEAGANVGVTARTPEELEATVAEIRRTYDPRAAAVRCDVTEKRQIVAMVEWFVKVFGRIDILVNNAGGSCPAVPFFDLEEEVWDLHVDRNLKSVFLCSQIVGKRMAESGGGTIINISSVMGMGPDPKRAPYSAAKAGVIALTGTLAVELAPHNIRVNAIAPGFIEVAKMWKLFPNYEQTVRKARLLGVPLGRMGAPEDVAGLAVFLASNASRYMTGQVIRMDGGLITTVFYKDERRDEWW
jgi:NAD(P)-dependent dehydrogenase (short-subunit alcohol dehydrogenase family)